MWLNEYCELMFDKTNNEEFKKKAVELKFLHMPNTLYKYRSVNTDTIKALEGDYLMCSAPSLLNDPYENLLSMNYESHYKLIYERIIKSVSQIKNIL